MRCPFCGRSGQRGEHERNVRRLTGWAFAIVFTAGIIGGAVLTVVGAGIWAAA